MRSLAEEGLGALGLSFLFLTLSQGLLAFRALHSFSRAVPYFASLIWHLLASAGWLWSSMLLARQLRHLSSCGQCPSAAVSIVSPYSWAMQHFWQLAGGICWWSFSSCCALQSQQHWVSLHRRVVWSSLQQFLHWVTGGRSWKAWTEQCLPNAARDL